jgi:hypothetical protein
MKISSKSVQQLLNTLKSSFAKRKENQIFNSSFKNHFFIFIRNRKIIK